MKRLLAYLKPHKWVMTAATVLVLFIIVVELYRPIVIGDAIDDYINGYYAPYIETTADAPGAVPYHDTYLTRDFEAADGQNYDQILLYNNQYYMAENLSSEECDALKNADAATLSSYVNQSATPLTRDDLKDLRHYDFAGILKAAALYLLLLLTGFVLNALDTWILQKMGQEITPKEIQTILEGIEGLPNEPQISRLTLRTMKQAKYTTECSGHFGLAAKYYCHFTSPIRRYPDLQIHRIIKDKLRGRLEREGKTEHYKEILEDVARQSSVCERRADEAERESDKLKKAEYMSYHIGEEFEGIISGVTGWGFYVELPNTVEGLVHVNTLRDDYYTFDQDAYELRGDVTGKVFALGQKVRVRVAEADTMLKTVDFVLAEQHDW